MFEPFTAWINQKNHNWDTIFYSLTRGIKCNSYLNIILRKNIIKTLAKPKKDDIFIFYCFASYMCIYIVLYLFGKLSSFVKDVHQKNMPSCINAYVYRSEHIAHTSECLSSEMLRKWKTTCSRFSSHLYQYQFVSPDDWVSCPWNRLVENKDWLWSEKFLLLLYI